ncbi:ABC transporter substrate-binding protein [Azospirillum griseum]|uniref:Iron ABC transporter substrate-binding protein n=1 Tax=Azospirillum griseum TaxID=2496639 RepID=A0A431VCN6_9PROT|nr:ABC transporter substrate-binding protein [Azospirillum griseum]RTR16550.1 iron ABC transporter substrate-binding protein [Azospirillum griseum]
MTSAIRCTLGLLACLLASPATPLHAEVKTVTDVIGRTVKADLPAKRVLLGFYFEDFMAVGGPNAFDSVVGISRDAWAGWVPANWAMHVAARPSLDTIADVGEVEAQTFSVEKVLALKPDLVVLADWQYKALGLDADRIEESGIPILVVDFNAQTLERHLASARVLGEATGQAARAAEIADLYQTAMKDVAARIAKAGKPKPKVYVEFGNKGPAEHSFTYGKNMWGAMATAAGGDNIAAPFVEWWGPINPEKVLAANPDAIFISGRENNKNETAMTMGQKVDAADAERKLAAFANRPGWSQVTAIKNGKLFGVYQGASRTLSDFAMAQFIAKQLYPEQFADVDPLKNYLAYYEKYLPVRPAGTFVVSWKKP